MGSSLQVPGCGPCTSASILSRYPLCPVRASYCHPYLGMGLGEEETAYGASTQATQYLRQELFQPIYSLPDARGVLISGLQGPGQFSKNSLKIKQKTGR